MFKAKHDEVLEHTEVDEDFYRTSALPEAPMLKQEKKQQTESIHSPDPVSMVYSSSSTVFTPEILLAMVYIKLYLKKGEIKAVDRGESRLQYSDKNISTLNIICY
jgi:hypothetical protein